MAFYDAWHDLHVWSTKEGNVPIMYKVGIVSKCDKQASNIALLNYL